MVEPITWVPSAVLSIPAATAAAEPLLDPPVRRRSCGLRVPRGSVAANSVVTVFPTMIAPGNARGVALGAPAREERRAILGRHVGGFDDVLDAKWHTVDGRAGPGLAPAFGGFVGGCTRPLKIEMHESTDLWFEYGEIGKAALEKIARCISAIGKARRGVEVRLWHEFELFFRRQHDDALRCLRPLSLAHVITNGLRESSSRAPIRSNILDHNVTKIRWMGPQFRLAEQDVRNGAERTVFQSVRIILPKRAHVLD